MLIGLILVLAVLWFFGYVHITGLNVPDFPLFMINGQSVTLWNLLILAVVISLIGILPGPLRIIAGLLLILWVLSVIGIISLAGIALSNILILAIIIGAALSLFTAAF